MGPQSFVCCGTVAAIKSRTKSCHPWTKQSWLKTIVYPVTFYPLLLLQFHSSNQIWTTVELIVYHLLSIILVQVAIECIEAFSGSQQKCTRIGPLSFPNKIQMELLGKQNNSYNSFFRPKANPIAHKILIVIWAKSDYLCS